MIYLFCCLAAALALPTVASASTYSNPAGIAINDGSCSMAIEAPAVAYPSPIPVSGAPTVIDDVNVTIAGFGHGSPGDLRVLLAGPLSGQRVLLMNEVGGNSSVTGVTATFDDAASGFMQAPIISGTYKPTRTENGCITFAADDTLPAPAPAGPYATTLASLNGTNPNGTWNLYIVDDFAGGTGQITGGWSLDISASTPTGSSPPPGTTPLVPTPPTLTSPGKKCKKKQKHRATSAKKCKKKRK